MKGLDLAQKYYEAFGIEMLQSQFSHVLPFLAIGLSGSGSECYGYDDDISRDHDFEPGFCIFLPGEDVVDRRTAFLLERAYAKLPKEFMDLKRNAIDPVGGNRHGVIRMEDFFISKTGSPNGELSTDQWFALPEYALLEAINGVVFKDYYGQFTAIREMLRYFPEDIWRKKLAGRLLLMAQAGQYNYHRCISRGDTGAAQLAIFEFAQSALHCIYLLNRVYMPYYKWSFRGLKDLPQFSTLSPSLEHLISTDNSPALYKEKSSRIEQICTPLAETLQTLTGLQSADLERQAYRLNDTISDHSIRNLHILHGV